MTVIPQGVGARDGRGVGAYSTTHTWSTAWLDRPNHPGFAPYVSPTRSVEVELVSLPSILDNARKRHPDRSLALKMDCEGCEFEAFETDTSCESFRAVKSILVEVHDDRHLRRSLCRSLEGAGFSVEELSPAGRLGYPLLLATRGAWEESAATRNHA